MRIEYFLCSLLIFVTFQAVVNSCAAREASVMLDFLHSMEFHCMDLVVAEVLGVLWIESINLDRIFAKTFENTIFVIETTALGECRHPRWMLWAFEVRLLSASLQGFFPNIMLLL